MGSLAKIQTLNAMYNKEKIYPLLDTKNLCCKCHFFVLLTRVTLRNTEETLI